MVNIIGIVIITFFVIVVGGGFGYLIWLKTRPIKITWQAHVYQLSESTKNLKIGKDGNITSNIPLNELKPYAKDIIEKVEKPGLTVFRLKKLNIPTPAVDEANVVEYWGKDRKEVSVVLHKGSATLLKKGYDKDRATLIFRPLPHSRINILKSEMATKKDRLSKEKDILQAITPWIIAGICMLGLISIAYVMIDGFIEVSENIKNGLSTLNAMDERLTQRIITYEELRTGVKVNPDQLGKQEVEEPKNVQTVQDG